MSGNWRKETSKRHIQKIEENDREWIIRMVFISDGIIHWSIFIWEPADDFSEFI